MGDSDNNERPPDPEEVVDAAAIDAEEVVDAAGIDAEKEAAAPAASKRKRSAAIERPYPRRTLEDALRVAQAIKTGNNGNPVSVQLVGGT